jgi:pimeloyl-ACP methyl ester carboxylesterase
MQKALPQFLLNSESQTAIVFIHGLGGSYNTWNDFSNCLHNSWVESDSFSLEYDDYYNNVKKIPFYTFVVKNIFGNSIENLAKHLSGFLKTVCDKYNNIILVCHSMGGLVARKYIVDLLNKDRNVGKVKGLITYATPHYGSSWANISKALFRNPLKFFSFGSISLFSQIKDLSKNGNFITELNNEWSKLNVSSKIDFVRVVGQSDWIVNEKSGSFEEDETVISCANKDHFSIIKPHPVIKDNALYVTYNYLKKFNETISLREQLNDSEYPEENELEF